MRCDGSCGRDIAWTRAGRLVGSTLDHKTYTMIRENDAGDEELLVGFTRNRANLVDGMLHDGPMMWFKCAECYLRENPKKILEEALKRTQKAHLAYREADRDEKTLMDLAEKIKDE